MKNNKMTYHAIKAIDLQNKLDGVYDKDVDSNSDDEYIVEF